MIDSNPLISHPIAEIFSDVGDIDLQLLAEDIRENGQLVPIVTYEGMILDGRHRYKVCAQLGLKPKVVEWSGQHGTPLNFVMAHNMIRRHLTSSQRATCAQRYLEYQEAEAKKRQGTRTDLNIPEIVPGSETGEAREKTAEAFGTNAHYVSDAKKLAHEAPDLFDEVHQGEKTIPQAKKELAKRIGEDIDEDDEPKKPHVSQSTGDNEWYTPPEYIEAAKKVMGGIDLDPASSDVANVYVQAREYYTKQDDGLLQKWFGKVWMNPPYSQPLVTKFCELFVQKLVEKEFETGCVLVNNATETKWFQGLLQASDAICLIKGRVKFISPEGSSGAPLQGQILLYFGPNVEGFINVFSKFGRMLVPHEK